MAVIQPPLDQPHQQTQSWQKTVADKIEADIGKIPLQWILDPHVVAAARDRRKIAGEFIESLLDNDRSRITSMDVVQLVNEMGTGQLSAVQVVTAFSKRAAYAHQLSNLLLEIGFDIGIKEARKLDQYFEEHRELIGPLHGVPVTLKDQFHVKGLGTSMAFAGWIGTFEGCKDTGKEKSFESQLVTDLISLGAVPIGKTPLVQSIWAMRGAPHNQLLSTGGSSGGEGAIQALRGSAFSVDTNIGGSVSMPASFHGVFSLKPSANRMPFRGVANTGPGQQVMPTVAGFMGHSIETLEVVFKSILSTKPWIRDPILLPIPWREDRELGGDKQLYKPSFGYMADDGLVTPHPAIDWALRIVKSALQHLDYDIIEWQPPSANESIQIHGPIARGDGCPDVFEAIQLSGEPIVPEISHLFLDGKLRDPLPLPEWENVVIHMKAYRER